MACQTGGETARDQPLLALSTRTIDLRMPFGQSASGEAHVTGRLAHTARLAVHAVEPPGPVVTILPDDGGGAGGVRVRVDGKQVGRAAGQVILDTGLANPSTLVLLYSWQVSGNLTVTPTNPFLDSRGGTEGVDVAVSSLRPDLRLDAANVVQGPFRATFRRDDATGVYVVHVRASAPAQGDPRGIVGTLRLVSNDPAEPTRDVPLFALGSFGARP